MAKLSHTACISYIHYVYTINAHSQLLTLILNPLIHPIPLLYIHVYIQLEYLDDDFVSYLERKVDSSRDFDERTALSSLLGTYRDVCIYMLLYAFYTRCSICSKLMPYPVYTYITHYVIHTLLYPHILPLPPYTTTPTQVPSTMSVSASKKLSQKA